jgi:hypothetical protein
MFLASLWRFLHLCRHNSLSLARPISYYRAARAALAGSARRDQWSGGDCWRDRSLLFDYTTGSWLRLDRFTRGRLPREWPGARYGHDGFGPRHPDADVMGAAAFLNCFRPVGLASLPEAELIR